MVVRNGGSDRGQSAPGLLVFALVTASQLAACASAGSPVPTPTPTPTAVASLAAPTPSPGSGAEDAAGCARRTVAAMTEDQRIGQLFLLGLAGNRLGPEETRLIVEEHVGSVWFTERTFVGASAIASVAAGVQALRTMSSTGGVGFLVAANQEGGVIQALHGPGFGEIPSALQQGRVSPGTLQGLAQTWGSDLKAAGVNLDFAPVADVVPPGSDAQNQPIGSLARAFGHDAGTVGADVAAFTRGLHGAGVAVTLKHFPGLGRVTRNTDFNAAVDSTTTAPDDSFRQGVDAGADLVMVSLARYELIDSGRLAVFSPAVVTGMLRDRLNFRGVIVSDDLGATAAVADIAYGDRATRFLDAGGDMIVSKSAAATRAMIVAIRARSAQDPTFRERLSESAARVLLVKRAAELVAC